MRIFIYGTILILASIFFCVSLFYLDRSPFDIIGSRLMSISLILYIAFVLVSISDAMLYTVLWIVRKFKK